MTLAEQGRIYRFNEEVKIRSSRPALISLSFSFWTYYSKHSNNMASDELSNKLKKRTDVITSAEEGKELPAENMPSMQIFNPYTEFKEFSRKEIQQYQKTFNE